MAMVWLGGWLLATHAFRLRSRERLIVGLGLGLALYAWLANIAGHWLGSYLAFTLPALALLAAGGAFGWRRKEGPWLDRRDLSVWPLLVAGLALFWVFALWSKGVTMFDEHKNLSLISIMGNGDIPPRFHAEAYPLNFIYHYGFHFIGASLMRLGGMLPWSAFDASKAFLWAEMVLLAYVLGRRVIGQAWGGLTAAAVIALASGTRFLLLLLPPGLLLQADKLITLQGTSALIGKPFSEALISPWPVDGGPAMPYMFGFLNGIMDPMVMAHQGPNIFAILILLLVWLLLPHMTTRASVAVIAALFAIWALAWETSYGLFMLGLFGFAVLFYWKRQNLSLPDLKPALVAALISVPIVILQGGTITETLRDAVFGIEGPGLLGSAGTGILGALPAFGPSGSNAAADIIGFSLRWPPAILSAHLGPLSLLSPVELIVGLFELGPVVLFTPWITRWAWRRANAGDWVQAAFVVSAWLGLLIPIFVQYEADRDISRLSWQALLTLTVMLLFVAAERDFAWPRWMRNAAAGALAVMIFGGLVIAGTQFSSASTTKLGDGYNELDAELAAQLWGRMPADAYVFGPMGSTTVLTGHLSGKLLDAPPPSSVWHTLDLNPSLDLLLASGYNFAYVDSRWWENLSPELQAASGLDAGCVVTLAEVWDNSRVNFRRMLDLRACVN